MNRVEVKGVLDWKELYIIDLHFLEAEEFDKNKCFHGC